MGTNTPFVRKNTHRISKISIYLQIIQNPDLSDENRKEMTDRWKKDNYLDNLNKQEIDQAFEDGKNLAEEGIVSEKLWLELSVIQWFYIAVVSFIVLMVLLMVWWLFCHGRSKKQNVRCIL